MSLPSSQTKLKTPYDPPQILGVDLDIIATGILIISLFLIFAPSKLEAEFIPAFISKNPQTEKSIGLLLFFVYVAMSAYMFIPLVKF